MFGEQKYGNLHLAWMAARNSGATLTACSAKLIAVFSFTAATELAGRLEPPEIKPTQLSMEVSP